MDLGTRFVAYLPLSALLFVTTGPAGVIMLWLHYAYEVYLQNDRMTRYRNYKAEQERKYREQDKRIKELLKK